MTSSASPTVSLRLALALGGTTVTAAALDDKDRILAEVRFTTPSGGALMEACRRADDRRAFMDAHWDAFIPHREALLDRACAAALEAARRAGTAQRQRPVGIGISAPGAIHPLTGCVEGRFGALNMPAWGAFNIREAVERRTGLSARAVNDGKAMALGAWVRMDRDVVEVRLRDDPSSHACLEMPPLGPPLHAVEDFIEIDPGTGLGGAYVVAGRLWFGHDPHRPDPQVGEIWNLPVDPDRPETDFEDLASGRVTFDRAAERVRKAFPGEEGEAILRASKGRIQAMLRSPRPGVVEAAEQALDTTGRAIALGMKYLMTHERERLRAPEIRNFVVGGGMVSGGSEEARKVRAVLARAVERALERCSPRPRLLFCTLGAAAGIFGAAALVRDLRPPRQRH